MRQPTQELGIDQTLKEFAAGFFIEAPQTLRLLSREAQPWHLEELAADAFQHPLTDSAPALSTHGFPSIFLSHKSHVVATPSMTNTIGVRDVSLTTMRFKKPEPLVAAVPHVNSVFPREGERKPQCGAS